LQRLVVVLVASSTLSVLHHTIMRHFIERGHAPSIDDLSELLGQPRDAVVAGLRVLEEYHGVVLHPVSAEVWAIHPFSSAPTNFWVESARGAWWGNCAWCSLGIVALLGEDATITTVLGGESEQVIIRIEDGVVTNDRLLVHFPIPMRQAWDNVQYTCSNMLVFATEADIDRWCARHRMPKGDVQPLPNVWAFARVWYGRHLDVNWVKWTAAEAQAIFEGFGLVGPTWEIPTSSSRF